MGKSVTIKNSSGSIGLQNWVADKAYTLTTAIVSGSPGTVSKDPAMTSAIVTNQTAVTDSLLLLGSSGAGISYPDLDFPIEFGDKIFYASPAGGGFAILLLKERDSSAELDV